METAGLPVSNRWKNPLSRRAAAAYVRGMGGAAYKIRRKYTWDDYRTWPDDERWEIIGGEAHAMSPAPGLNHQEIQACLVAALVRAFRKGPCRVHGAPTDVKLSADDVVQPDVLVVCDEGSRRGSHVEGPPKLVVEILSASSIHMDRGRKRELYEKSGVPEYWIVTPFPETVEVYSLDGATYRLLHVFTKEDTLVSPAFPKLKIRLKDVFAMPPDPNATRLLVREEGPRPGRKQRVPQTKNNERRTKNHPP